jgi:hypothetical protein
MFPAPYSASVIIWNTIGLGVYNRHTILKCTLSYGFRAGSARLGPARLCNKRARLVKLATRCGSKIINMISISIFLYVIDTINLINCASNTDEHNLTPLI